MNALGITFLWCVVQVTILTSLTIGLYYLLRRLGPRVGVAVALSAVALITGLSLLAFSPWPRWTLRFAGEGDVAQATAQSEDSNAPSNTSSPAPSSPSTLDADGAFSQEPLTLAFWDALRDELARASTPNDTTKRPAWPGVLAALVIVGAVLGTARLALGLIAVRRYRRQSTPIDDARVAESIDVLLAEIGCRRRPEMRESDAFFSAATVGWRRPVILLPAAWRKWNEHELRAVLAHEIAHIQGGDSLACLVAQVALALHFYHPLVHWLVARLHLEQELAADATAAELSGGRQSYLKTLAAMALDQEDKNVVWPARAFVPARTAFLRRIVVLRNFHRPIRTTSGRTRALAALCVMAAGLAVAGLRPPARGQVAAQEPTREETEAIDLSYVPEDASFVAAFRPAAILIQARQLGLEELVNSLAASGGPLDLPLKGVDPEGLEQLTTYTLLPTPGDNVILRMTGAVELADLLPPNAEKRNGQGKDYYVWDNRAYLQLDDRTLALCAPARGTSLERLLSIRPGNGPAFLRREKWCGTENDVCVAAYHAELFHALVSNPANNVTVSPPALAALFRGPMDEIRTVVLGLHFEDGLKASGAVFCKSEDGTARVRETLDAYKVLGRNMLLEKLSQMQGMDKVLDAALDFFGSLKMEVQGSNLQISAALPLDKKIAAQIAAAGRGVRRVESVNNLKMLGLAIHNYYDKYKQFPAAVLLGPDGKTPYSWRVAILPMLGQQSLYDRYRFDEPWDGPHNRKLLAEMPDEYRDPDAPVDSQNACYFALTGPETVFPSEGTIRFAEIMDGTVNTLMFVEARRDIPWTKPEDIPYASDKPIPKLGGFTEGGFHASFCSTTVRFLPDSLSETDFRAMATRAGGEEVEYRDK